MVGVCWLLFVVLVLIVRRCRLLAVACSLVVVCWLFCVGRCGLLPLFAVRCSLFVFFFCCWLCCLLFDVCCRCCCLLFGGC